MNDSDKLFLLIKSLNKNEKGYFKKFASKGNNNSIKLFDAIAKQKIYDKKKLFKRIGHETFSKKLSANKGILYENILRSLQNFHYNSSLSATLKNNLLHIEILFDRGLYSSCAKLLAKVKKEATLYEDEGATALMELIKFERLLGSRLKNNLIEIDNERKRLKEEEDQIIKRYANSREYVFLVDSIASIRSKSQINKKESRKLISELIKHPLLKNETKALSFSAKLSFNNFFRLFYGLNNDHVLSIKYSKRCVDLLESQPEKWKHKPLTYTTTLFDLGIDYYALKDYRNTLAIIDKIKNISKNTIDYKIRTFFQVAGLELATYNEIAEFKKASNLITTITKILNDYTDEGEPGRLLHFYFEIAYSFFGLEDYKTSLKWVNKIENVKNKGGREDITNIAPVLSMILHFEMNNDDLLESKIRSASRFYAQKASLAENPKNLFHKEVLLIQFFRTALLKKSKKNTIEMMKDLKAAVLKEVKSPSDNLENFITDWLTSKIEKKSFAEVIREKAKPYL